MAPEALETQGTLPRQVTLLVPPTPPYRKRGNKMFEKQSKPGPHYLIPLYQGVIPKLNAVEDVRQITGALWLASHPRRLKRSSQSRSGRWIEADLRTELNPGLWFYPSSAR